MRYVREWRSVSVASMALATSGRAIAAIAHDAGDMEPKAAFNRAFSRTFGVPPATWRQDARRVARGG